jgi:N utilization substance protein A
VVVVDEDQVSLAMAKRGQNVRLAGKLLNATINIKSEEDKKRDLEQELVRMAAREEAVEALKGVGPKTAEALVAGGVKTIGEAIDAGIDGLLAVDGVGPKGAEKILRSAEELLAASVSDEPEVHEVVVDGPGADGPLTELDSTSVSPRLGVNVQTDDADVADEIVMGGEVDVADAEAGASPDNEDETPVPADTDEEEVVEASA